MPAEKSEKKRGRPRKDRHLDDYAAAGEPPRDDVLAVGRWLLQVVAITAHQARSGRGSAKVRKGIRASCMAAARLLPSTIAARALDLGEPDIDPAGPPPADPLQVSEWFLANLVDDVHRQISGTADDAVSAEWRAASTAGVKVWPPDTMVEARRILRESLVDEATDGPESDAFGDACERPWSLNLFRTANS